MILDIFLFVIMFLFILLMIGLVVEVYSSLYRKLVKPEQKEVITKATNMLLKKTGIKQPQGTVFKPRTQEEIEKERSEKFYSQL